VSDFSVRFTYFAQLMRLDRLVGVWLLLAPALCGLLFASPQHLPWKMLLVFSAGAFLMRSAGCVINDLADRDLDGFVARTASRPLASGRVSVMQALGLLLVLLLLSAALLFFLNFKTILLAIFALPIVVIYPFCKRFMPCPQAVLGIAFAWPILLAYSAVQAKFTLATWLLFAGVWAWVVAYDTAYAMSDRADDLKVGIKSSAIWFGRYERIFIVILNCISLLCFVAAGLSVGLNKLYFIGIVFMFILFANTWRMIWRRDAKLCFAAFQQNIYIGLLWFVAIIFGLHFL
jgi:4-hydroxybenzoate polyprenyltransferase